MCSLPSAKTSHRLPSLRVLGCLACALVLPLLSASCQAAQTAIQNASKSTAKSTPKTSAAAALAEPVTAVPSETKPAASSAATKSADTAAALQAKIAKLPPLQGTGIDAPARSKDILTHLNATLRFYRAAVLPLQKVGEPTDVLYQEQASADATQIAKLAFEAATNEAALLSKVAGSTTGQASKTPAATTAAGKAESQAQRIAAIRTQVTQQLAGLEAQDAALSQQIGAAHGKQLATLKQQQQQIEGELELQKAMSAALGRISSFSEAQSQTGLAGDIDRLQRSAPELLSATAKPVTPALLENLNTAREAGVTSQAAVLFQLLSTRQAVDEQIRQIDILNTQANNLRSPVLKILRATVQQGQALSQQAVNLDATPTTDAQDRAATRKQFDTLTTTFQVLSDAALPLSQELVLLEQGRGTLSTWRTAVDSEYKSILRSLLLRLFLIVVALSVLALLSNVWSRATVRYVQDFRRRRQLLVVRRAVVGFVGGLIVIFGFVTQVGSLATFAGFISAGIAVGLQTILLSVAAYFFIIGRYGVRVGDRITVANVTGEVIEVGLVRFYMLELAGTGTELHSTGRVAVFANSVLFQTGTPLYKQMPGTEYAWHELTVKLNVGADVHTVTDAVLGAINGVFATYSARIDQQHQQGETWVGTPLDAPKVDARLQLAEGGLQLAVLFPVEIGNAAEVDQQIAETLLGAINGNDQLKAGIAATPVIKAAIKP